MYSGKSDERLLGSYAKVKIISAAICLGLAANVLITTFIVTGIQKKKLFLVKEYRVLKVIFYLTVQLYMLLISPINSKEKF